MKRMRIALIAHDVNKENIVSFVERNGHLFCDCDLAATASICSRLSNEPGVIATRVQSDPLSGDLQIGAQLAAGDVSADFFLQDPWAAMPHEADIAALWRVCDVHDIPGATDLASAEFMIHTLRSVKQPPKHGVLRTGTYGHPPDASHVMEQAVPNRDGSCVLELLGQSH